ncbi:hypothetical protein [Limnoglobus roseus]|uniref:Uncharacterized protein n=1 Tax=Limnoglobus roseus TaxID=2598579 RepID=A0A5C1AMW3_9BACT|nr:hypothetical protein [Limnoglobus roseus]QEL19326.1 hypothetical protein PX52LOC_06394 [Limnoglobus roseus]
MTALDFMSNSPYLALFRFWLILRIVTGIALAQIRHLNIRLAGWPPAHLDADGDFEWQPPSDRQNIARMSQDDDSSDNEAIKERHSKAGLGKNERIS